MKTLEPQATMELERAPIQEPSGDLNMMAILERAARDPACDVNKAERFLEMALKMKALDAEQRFNAAMAACQAEMPAVYRDANNTSTQSKYARMETLNAAVVPVYTKHGFGLSFGTAECPTQGWHRTTCFVTHADGHSRKEMLDMPNDSMGMKGNPTKTQVHGAGSTLNYSRRYLTMLIFNVSFTNVLEDDDGNRAGQKPQQAPGMATEKTRAWFLENIKDIGDEAFSFANEHGWLSPDEKVQDWPLAQVPITKTALAKLRADILEWAKQ